jgi:flavin-dependent dehydrogenase
MSRGQYDVLVVGAGCAGLTAAIGLARSGFTVAVIEADSIQAGGRAIGGVCFAETLSQPDILGPDGVEALAWERRLIERGQFATDGRRLVGGTYRDPEAFRHCYTVLRPRFNQHLLQIALGNGVDLVADTTVESLIHEGRRVIGVATTRGPQYGDLVFLAEGDAGHLVSRERLDRSNDPRAMPLFLYSLQQVIELSPGAIEEAFDVGPEQGIAYELLLRNEGRARLNARGFVCTNRQGVTLSVVLPADHLRRYFAGQPRQLLEWFADMPSLRLWWRDGRAGAWTATLLRAGGMLDVPYLIEDGLAIGGAAAGLGVDFPVLNALGPATATGLLLSRAAVNIRAQGGGFDREQLRRHYLEPLQQTRHWKDKEFLHRWPRYLQRTPVLFDGGLDLLLDSAAAWTRPRRWLPRKCFAWFRVLGRIGWTTWTELIDDLFHLGNALRLREVTPRPALARVLLDGALNTFRDLARQPRPHLPPGGTLALHYRSTEDDGSARSTTSLLRLWFGRFRPVLASASHILYRNGDMPLSEKLTRLVELLVRQINLLDLLAAAGLGFLTVLASTVLGTVGYLLRWMFRRRKAPAEGGPALGEADTLGEHKEVRTGSDASAAEPVPRIHIVWKSTQPRERADAVRELRHVCPTGVFEVDGEPPEAVEVSIRGEWCIHCEACWRIVPCVDWGRGGGRPLPASARSPLLTRLRIAEPRDSVSMLIDKLDRKLLEFEEALARGTASVDQPRGDYLEMLARYAQQLASQLVETLQCKTWPAGATAMKRRVLELATALAAKTEERTRRTWASRFAWAAADGRQLRQHHLTGLRRLLGLGINPERVESTEPSWAPSPFLRDADATVMHLLADIAARRYLLETLDNSPTLIEAPTRVELLSAVATEVHSGLAAQLAELSAHLGTRDESSKGDGPPVGEVFPRLGAWLLADAGLTKTLLDVEGDWATLTQRRALLAEREELEEAEDRLAALARDWRACQREKPAEAEVSAGLARQAAHILAGKLLLLRTHNLLEEGCDAELAIVLLRVWLDYTATLLDQFTILVRDHLRPPPPASDRPLVEPGAGSPPRTWAEFRAAMTPGKTGDFLLAPVDLLQPRLVPEMAADGDDLAAVAEIRDRFTDASRTEESVYLAEALTMEMIGRCVDSSALSLDLETACARLILADLRPCDGALGERSAILRSLADEVIPRALDGPKERGVRHLGRDVLELEALKGEFRQRLLAVWQFFGGALGRNADVQASCFALAEAAAWLKAADSVLGRMAWNSRLSQSEDRDEPAAQDTGRRVLAHCHAQVRDRLFRFDEDLAALRRGYYAPHVRAALLLMSKPETSSASADSVEESRILRENGSNSSFRPNC